MDRLFSLIDTLAGTHTLPPDEYEALICGRTPALAAYAAERADALRRRFYANHVYIRGLCEITNICRNDCRYCGIRRSNANCGRYRLDKADILRCCENGYRMGFRTFVLQGGEGAIPVDELCGIVSDIKSAHPDCAVTLSVGEYGRAAYQAMFEAGADRYLLRHETANQAHYELLHPAEMSFSHRMQCLRDLKEIGFQVGCGFMVGSPYQTPAFLAQDLKFIEEFSPDMCGIGPFIPQKDTPFRSFPAGSAEETIFLLSLVRLIKPNLLLPATTALGTALENGRELAIKAGANVVMPNLSPVNVRHKYALYDNKCSTGVEDANQLQLLRCRLREIGYEAVVSRGDIKSERIEEICQPTIQAQ